MNKKPVYRGPLSDLPKDLFSQDVTTEYDVPYTIWVWELERIEVGKLTHVLLTTDLCKSFYTSFLKERPDFNEQESIVDFEGCLFRSVFRSYGETLCTTQDRLSYC